MSIKLEPELILPEQLRVSSVDLLQPERRLLLAVLEDAIVVLVRYAGCTTGRPVAQVREIETWLEDRDASALYSFENICSVLDFDPNAVRAGLRRLVAQPRTAEGRPQRVALARRVSGERHRISARRQAIGGCR